MPLAKDDAFWARVFDENYVPVFRYAYARLGAREEAEEIAAQVFLEALRSVHRYTPTDKPLLAWLYGIARRLVANHLRRRQRASNAYDRFARNLSIAVPVEDRVENLDLVKALGRLTLEQREVIILRFISGLSTTEIAEALHRTPAAVYSLQVRALGALRRQLSD